VERAGEIPGGSRLGVAAIGGPETVRRKLARLVWETKADELIFTSICTNMRGGCGRSKIAAEAMKALMVAA